MAGTACCGVRADATITDRCITRVTRFAAAVTGVASEESFATVMCEVNFTDCCKIAWQGAGKKLALS